MLALALLLHSSSSFALGLDETPVPGENSLHIDGASYHFSRLGQNEANFGLGFSYGLGMLRSDQRWLDRTPLTLDADLYRDSTYKPAHFVGLTARLIVAENWSAGLKTGIVHEESSTKQSHSFYIPYVLPFFDLALRPNLSLRTIVVPHVGNLTNGLAFFQLIVGLDSP
jgi:hypothetical protein